MVSIEWSEKLYRFIMKYALENKRSNTLTALRYAKEESRDRDHFVHCMSTAQLLINLNMPVSAEDEDVLLAAALLHELEGVDLIEDLDPQIYRIVSLLAVTYNMRAEDKRYYYTNIEKHRLAFLLALADRGNFLNQICELSASEAMEYVHDTRQYYLPMCLYGKANYQELQMIINILMEKLRNLVDVVDIISSRYQAREMAYTNEIFSLMEENARIHGMISATEAGTIYGVKEHTIDPTDKE